MSDEPQSTFTAREIVLELFPATPKRLIPAPRAYAVTAMDDGARVVRSACGSVLARLLPLPSAGPEATTLCCDLCGWSGPRRSLTVLRGEVAGSQGRRWRYLTACRDGDSCEARRLDDVALDRLLAEG
ncbi:hypothetical protein BH23DEI1_BH23DEI1_11810 [soil metagenome]|nr:hypothetical protein [Trueperaceae bacterium]